MTEEKDEKKENPAGVKSLSKCSMLFATLWIAVHTVLKGVGLVTGLTVSEITATGAAIVAMWVPGYFSLWIDKVIKGKE